MERSELDMRRRRLPGALVIGAVRAGTTWMHAYLDSRKDVRLPAGRKETEFFDEHYHRGLEWYAKQFQGTHDYKAIVEVAPTYFHCPEAPRRVKENLGDIKLICSLRNPISRAYSHYLQLRRYGRTTLGFREAVDQHPEILRASCYATNLRGWIDQFGRDKILVVFLEDLARDPAYYAAQVCRHLGLPWVAPADAILHPVNQTDSLPFSNALARLGWKASRLAHGLGLHAIVDLGTKLGLKTIFFGRPGAAALPKISDEDALWIQMRLEAEMASLEEFGVKLPAWKQPRQTCCAA